MSMRLTIAFIFVIAGNTIALGQDAPVRAGAPGVSHPHLRQTIVPVYPPVAVAARVSGTVLIEAIIDQTGRVTSATIVKSVPLLDAAAIESVRKWRFEPPRPGGRDVRFATTVTFDFRLFDVAAPRPLVTQAYDSGMPADFAVVYDDGCMLRRRPPPCTVTLMPPRDDLAAVFRELSEAGLLSRTDGLNTWNETGAAEITASDRGVSVAVAGVSPPVDAATGTLFVRSHGVWRRLSPLFLQRADSVDYAKQLAPARALIQRIIAGK